MRITEIVVGLADGSALRVRPIRHGATVVPVKSVLGAEAMARGIRQCLAAVDRDALADAAPKLQIRLQNGGEEVLVFDDRSTRHRVLKVDRQRGPATVYEADTNSLADELRVQRLLTVVASLFGLGSGADLMPALAYSGDHEDESRASPKEQAYKRAFERARQLSQRLEEIDELLAHPAGPNWLGISGVLAGTALVSIAISALLPHANRFVVPIAVLTMIAYLVRAAWTTWRDTERRRELPASSIQLRADAEIARAQVKELAEVLRKKGLDPEEVLERMVDIGTTDPVPSILSRESTSHQEVMKLNEIGRQIVLFVDARSIAGETFGDCVRSLEEIRAHANESTD